MQYSHAFTASSHGLRKQYKINLECGDSFQIDFLLFSEDNGRR